MRSAYLAWMMRRRSLRVGVSSSLSAVHSTGRTSKRLTCSIRARRWLAASTASWTSAEHLLVGGQGGQVVGAEAVAGGPAGGELVVEHDQGDHIRPVVAVDQGLADERVLLEEALDVGRGQVLAAGGDDQLFLAVDDLEVAVAVQLADVAGVQPALGVDQLGRRLRLPEVPGGVDRAPDQDLAVVGQADLDPGQGRADGADLDLARPVAGGHPGGLGHAVHLDQGQAEGGEELGHVHGQGRGRAGGEGAAVQPDRRA